MKKLIKIVNDCYFICQRIKEVDSSYEIYFNIENGCYEVHSNEQARNTYCFKVPYNQLDSRTIDFAFKTRVANIDQLIKEMDRSNDLLYEREVKKGVESLKEALSC